MAQGNYVKARLNRRQANQPRKLRAGPKRDTDEGLALPFRPAFTPTNPGESAVLRAATNGHQERSNPPPPLHEGVAGQAHGAGGGIGPEANAPGKAGGYADGARGSRGRAATEHSIMSTPATGVQEWRDTPLAAGRAGRPQAPKADLPSFPDGASGGRSTDCNDC